MLSCLVYKKQVINQFQLIQSPDKDQEERKFHINITCQFYVLSVKLFDLFLNQFVWHVIEQGPSGSLSIVGLFNRENAY